MRLWVMSDLHVDVLPEKMPMRLPNPRPDYDVLVIAGDICEKGPKAIKWIANNALARDKPVIFVMGNHEPYGMAIEACREKMAAVAKDYPNIHILQDSHVDIDGVRFIGATLWTDYCLYGEPYAWQCYNAAQSGMNDHRRIRVAADGYRRFRTKDAWREHCVSRLYIEGMLRQPFAGPRVVVSHHAPSSKSIDHARFAGDLLNGAFASDLDPLVAEADLWIHGHIHKTSDYRIGDGRVICNPRGYVGMGEGPAFDPALVVTISERSHRQNDSGIIIFDEAK